MDQIIQHLKKSKHVLITSHANLDGDAIGSMLAIGHSLAALDKKTTMYSETPVPAVYRFLPSSDRIVQKIDPANTYDSAIILDCGDIERIGKIVEWIDRIPVIINIDHHITNSNFGNYQLIDTSACASAEIAYRLIKMMDISIDKTIATSIYTGILTDTGSFRFSNTSGAAFAICNEMVQFGVDPYIVAQHVYGTYSLGRIQLLLLALNTIEISQNGKMSMMALTQAMFEESGTKPEDGDGLINYARIKDVEVAVLIREEQKIKSEQQNCAGYHVSLRSNGSIDVADIAATFGGGGHYSAAGFTIESTLSALKAQLFELTEDL